MRCRLRFRITGRIKPDVSVPVAFRGIGYEFEIKEGIITHIVATFPIDKQFWPTVTPSSTAGVKYHIEIPTPPQFFVVEAELRTLEGLLSLYGLQSIDVQHPEREWLSEDDGEQNYLKKNGLHSFRSELKPPTNFEIPPLEFDLIVRSIKAAHDAYEIEVPLSFFRKGRIDMYEGRYIEAIYDFYFMFETLFSDGHTKNYKVKESFTKSPLLRECIKMSMDNPRALITAKPELRKIFHETYRNRTIDDVIDRIVELRGFLHHHTSKRRNIWHPEKNRDYELDALVFEFIAFNLAFKISEKYIFHEDE